MDEDLARTSAEYYQVVELSMKIQDIEEIVHIYIYIYIYIHNKRYKVREKIGKMIQKLTYHQINHHRILHTVEMKIGLSTTAAVVLEAKTKTDLSSELQYRFIY